MLAIIKNIAYKNNEKFENNARCFVKILFVGASPSGKASAFGADIRWFESSRPSHSSKIAIFGDFFFFIKHLSWFEYLM